MQIFDTHAHLDFPFLWDQIDELLLRAKENHVERIVTIGASRGLESNQNALKIANQYDHIWCTTGIHPHDVEQFGDEAFETIKNEFANHPKVVAIGETGLDYFYDHAPKKKQEHMFRKHLRLAKALGKPVVIHSRDADKDTIAILKEEGVQRGILHCFTGSQWMAEELIKPELDFYLSFSGIVTFKNAKDILKIASEIVPLDRILVETDAPFLAPIPFRGKKNEPAFVYHTAKKIADARGIPLEDFSKQTYENSNRVFGLEP